MKFRLLGVLCVTCAATAIVAYKRKAARPAVGDQPGGQASDKASVVLVAAFRQLANRAKRHVVYYRIPQCEGWWLLRLAHQSQRQFLQR